MPSHPYPVTKQEGASAQEGESTRVERNKRGIQRKEAFLKRVRFLARSPAEGLKSVWAGSLIDSITAALFVLDTIASRHQPSRTVGNAGWVAPGGERNAFAMPLCQPHTMVAGRDEGAESQHSSYISRSAR
jgi:hypothetical protein